MLVRLSKSLAALLAFAATLVAIADKAGYCLDDCDDHIAAEATQHADNGHDDAEADCNCVCHVPADLPNHADLWLRGERIGWLRADVPPPPAALPRDIDIPPQLV